ECDCRSCSGSGKALCADGTCLERSRVCDGIVDCSDGADEEDCPGTCILDKNVKIPQVTCADGRRYPEAEACAGVIEQCAYNCTKCDKRLAFTCNDKKCVPQMLVCDGIEDCSGGEDESDCSCT
ncbi:Low-density lipoprotein receptor domain class A, partial [Teladorsagia circumcincta]